MMDALEGGLLRPVTKHSLDFKAGPRRCQP